MDLNEGTQNLLRRTCGADAPAVIKFVEETKMIRRKAQRGLIGLLLEAAGRGNLKIILAKCQEEWASYRDKQKSEDFEKLLMDIDKANNTRRRGSPCVK